MDGYLFIQGGMQHSFGSNEAAIAINLQNGQIQGTALIEKRLIIAFQKYEDAIPEVQYEMRNYAETQGIPMSDIRIISRHANVPF